MSDDDLSQYSIGEVSDMVGLKPHVLRYWETEFDVLAPEKNQAGRRVYTENDLAVVRRIQHLLKTEKYTIAGARQVFERERRLDEDGDAGRRKLLELRSFLTDLLEKL